MAYSEDHIALAAEYALGTLDADERAQVETMMAVDTEFAAIVQAWEYRLGALNQMVGSVEPRPIVWENIQAAIGHSTAQQAPLVLPEAPPAAPPPRREAGCRREAPPAAVGTFERHSNCRAGRRGAGAMSRRLPPRSPQPLSRCWRCRSISRTCCPTRCGRSRGPRRWKSRRRAAAGPSAQYVALLQRDGGSPAFILTVDAATKNFTVRKVGAEPSPARASSSGWSPTGCRSRARSA